jgi:hypothetical protein
MPEGVSRRRSMGESAGLCAVLLSIGAAGLGGAIGLGCVRESDTADPVWQEVPGMRVLQAANSPLHESAVVPVRFQEVAKVVLHQ